MKITMKITKTQASMTVQITEPMARITDADDGIQMFRESIGTHMIDASTARAIAALFASPAGPGEVIGRLSRGQEVDFYALVDDIRCSMPGLNRSDRANLEMLLFWATTLPGLNPVYQTKG